MNRNSDAVTPRHMGVLTQRRAKRVGVVDVDIGRHEPAPPSSGGAMKPVRGRRIKRAGGAYGTTVLTLERSARWSTTFLTPLISSASTFVAARSEFEPTTPQNSTVPCFTVTLVVP